MKDERTDSLQMDDEQLEAASGGEAGGCCPGCAL